MNTTRKTCWYTPGLNKFLSNNGYVHFVTKESITSDFKEGVAFYFDTETKECGKCDLISFDDNNTALLLRDLFKSLIEGGNQ